MVIGLYLQELEHGQTLTNQMHKKFLPVFENFKNTES